MRRKVVGFVCFRSVCLNLLPPVMRRFVFALAPLCFFLLAGCGGGGSADLGPPAGWSADGLDRWWKEGVDTSLAFRNLDTFEGMALGERPDGKRLEGPTHRNVQQEFVQLYRNQPEIIDSLFTEIAVPLVDARGQEENRDALIRDINREMNKVFFFARPKSEPQVQIIYPDSLRTAGVGGGVRLQVYLNEEGEPLAIKRIDAVHPTLDAIALRATTQKRWIPAALNGETIPSWVRSVTQFNTQ